MVSQTRVALMSAYRGGRNRKKKAREKVRYEIDPHNRLVVEAPKFKKTRLHYLRKVLDGRFKTGKNNILTYHVKAPVPRDTTIPHQVKLRGKWSLNKDHQLQLTLDKWGRQTFGDRLTLQGNIKDVRKNSLLFVVMTRTKENVQSTYGLKLEGSWQADKNNRLTFRVRKEKGRHDILIFDNIWEINKSHQIIYQYKEAHLLRKKKKVRTLTFRGHWDIRDKARISYVIDRNSGSLFHFKPALGVFRDGYIKYEIGIRLSHKPIPIMRTVTLYGRWKITRSAGLLFKVKYENGKVHAMTFGADAKLAGKDTISLRLRSIANKDMGVELKLSHKLLKGDGEIFLRGLRSKRESAIYAGAGWR